MVGIVPTPVLSSTVVVVQDPLETLQVLHQHLPLKMKTFLGGDILLQLSLIVESLGLNGVPGEFLNQISHELKVLLTVLVNYIFLSLYLGIQSDALLLLL